MPNTLGWYGIGLGVLMLGSVIDVNVGVTANLVWMAARTILGVVG